MKDKRPEKNLFSLHHRKSGWESIPQGARDEVPHDTSTLVILGGLLDDLKRKGVRPPQIASAFNGEGLRNRSGQRWSRWGIIALSKRIRRLREQHR